MLLISDFLDVAVTEKIFANIPLAANLWLLPVKKKESANMEGDVLVVRENGEPKLYGHRRVCCVPPAE